MDIRKLTSAHPGALIKQLRRERQWTAKMLSEVSGYDQDHIYDIEGQRFKSVSWAIAVDLLESLGYHLQAARSKGSRPRQEFCKRGHLLDGKRYVPPSNPKATECITCRRERSRTYTQRKRNATANPT